MIPESGRFRRSAWDELIGDAWDAPAWCDPGDVGEWIDRQQRLRGPDEAAQAEALARQMYERALDLRAERIALFTEVCRRADVPVPHVGHQLFDWCVRIGLFRIEYTGSPDPWVVPRLDRNPLELLPLTREEAQAEAAAQWDDRVEMVGIALRQYAEERGDDFRRYQPSRQLSFPLTLRQLGDDTNLNTGQLRQALVGLADATDLDTDPQTVGVESPFTVTLDWPHFGHLFPHDHPTPPEHGI